MGLKGRFLVAGALCLIAFSVHAEPAKEAIDPPLTRRRQLSPMAKAIDTMLFGDVQWLNFHDQNPFLPIDYLPDKSQLAAALKQVASFRGKSYNEMVARGYKLNQTFKREIKKATYEIFANEQLVTTPSSNALYSWQVLVATGNLDERKLTQAELNLKANAVTQTVFPLAFQGLDPPGLSDPDAAKIYNQAYNRSEIFDSAPDSKKIERELFEEWREKEITRLVKIIQRNVLRQIESQYRRGLTPFSRVTQPPAFDKDGGTLSFSELAQRIEPPAIMRRHVGGKLSFDYPSEVRFTFLPNETLMYSGSRVETQTFSSALLNHAQWGKLSVPNAAEGHLSEVLEQSNRAARDALRRLNQFQYEHYRADGGKGFFLEWKKGMAAERKGLDRVWAFPMAAQSQKKFEGSHLESALWARFSEHPEFWDKRGLRKSTIVNEVFGFRRIQVLSAELPTPASTRLANAGNKFIESAAIKAEDLLLSHPGATATLLGTAMAAGIFGTSVWLNNPGGENPSAPVSRAAADTNLAPSHLSAQGTAFNKPLTGPSTAPIFTLLRDSGEKRKPLRFSFGRPDQATTDVRVISYPLYSSHYRLGSELTHTGNLEIPTADGATLAFLRVVGSDGRVWARDKDYAIKQTPTGEYVVFPTSQAGYKIEAGFYGAPAERPQLKSASLKELNLDQLQKVAEELSANGFTYLPKLINHVVAVSRREKKSLSVFDLEEILQQSALYTQNKEQYQFFTMFRSELARAARFLNPEGVSCYMCDGAQELGVSIYKKTLGPQSDIEVLPRTVVVRQPGDNGLSLAGLHADFLLRDPFSKEQVVIDTTPPQKDPRDHLTHPPGLGASPPYVENNDGDKNSSEPGGKNSERRNLTIATLPMPSPGDKITGLNDQTESIPPAPVPWGQRLNELFTTWEKADRSRPFTREAVRPALVGAGLDPQVPSVTPHAAVKDTVEKGAPDPAEKVSAVKPPISAAGQIAARWVFDPKLKDLSTKLAALEKLIVALKLYPNKNDSIPTSSAVEIVGLIEDVLTREITAEVFQQRMNRHLPRDFEWPLVYSNQLASIVNAAGKRLSAHLSAHREQWKRGDTKSYPKLLDPRVATAVNGILKWAGEQTWEPARLVYDEPTRPGCAGALGQLAPTLDLTFKKGVANVNSRTLSF